MDRYRLFLNGTKVKPDWGGSVDAGTWFCENEQECGSRFMVFFVLGSSSCVPLVPCPSMSQIRMSAIHGANGTLRRDTIGSADL